MAENIADQIREDRRPEGKMFGLSDEAKRLRGALAVAQKWLEVAEEEDETGVFVTRAEYTRDQLEEELSKTAFEMEVLAKRGDMKYAPPVEDPEGKARAALLSDSLLSAYCILRDVPAEAFGGELPGRVRYAHMGALLAALEVADAEMKRCKGRQPA